MLERIEYLGRWAWVAFYKHERALAHCNTIHHIWAIIDPKRLILKAV